MEQGHLSDLTAHDIMTSAPKTMQADQLAVVAFQLMEADSISQLIVTRNGEYAGMVHLHDILKEGIY